ncbi:MAG: sigma 54-interacting transcriptional regulator [Deltaproteobacteria bacterium]|nr:sigma 54-interacting transcriptional regulator [Deltaproteobacteria bacterium]
MAAAISITVIVKGASATHALPATGTFGIGRAEESDLRIDDASISRRHARLHVGAAIEVEDLGSSNGTSIRATRFEKGGTARLVERVLKEGQRAEVRPGDIVLIGASVLLFSTGDQAATARSSETRAPSAHADPQSAAGGPVVVDEAMRKLHELASRLALGDISVLLLGETGAGKDALAEVIHRASPRAHKPLLRLNCAALSESLVESELFGHERGAFTGAAANKRGLLESAEGGTVFLDEVGELPMSTQAKLLHAIERREVMPVGGLRPRPLDVRFLSATNRDLDAAVEAGTFRRDLFYRLNGALLFLPPLRERKAEILALSQTFLLQARAKNGKPPITISPQASERLLRHSWPGNVRELRNVIERAALLAVGPELVPEDLELSPSTRGPSAPAARAIASDEVTPAPGLSHREELDALERRRIVEALEKAGGNQSEAALALGIPRRTFLRRLQQYGLARPKR